MRAISANPYLKDTYLTALVLQRMDVVSLYMAFSSFCGIGKARYINLLPRADLGGHGQILETQIKNNS